MASAKADRIGMYIYCTEDEKRRIARCAEQTRRTLTDYVMLSVLQQVERDERRLTKSSKPASKKS